VKSNKQDCCDGGGYVADLVSLNVAAEILGIDRHLLYGWQKKGLRCVKFKGKKMAYTTMAWIREYRASHKTWEWNEYASFREIGQELGISTEMARNIYNNAMRKLSKMDLEEFRNHLT
jgi:transposase-like protein